MSPVHQSYRVGRQVVTLEEDVAGPEISERHLIYRNIKISLLVTDGEELGITSLHLIEDHVVDCPIPCHLFEQEDGGLDRRELLQEGEVGLQVTVHQAAGHHLPALLRLHTQCIISGCKLQANFIGVGNIY